MAEAANRGCEVVQYSPNEVKQAVTGYGAATKKQVQTMVQTLLGLAELPSPPDAADAAALALCHLAMAPMAAAAARAEQTSPGGDDDRLPARHRCSTGGATASCSSRSAASATA